MEAAAKESQDSDATAAREETRFAFSDAADQGTSQEQESSGDDSMDEAMDEGSSAG